MKNISKIVGIIAILAIIGLMAGCELEADPDDQIGVTVNGLPSGANGFYAIMGLTDGTNTVATTLVPRGIVNGSSTNLMVYPGETKAFGKSGNYIVIIKIYKEESMTTELYSGFTDSKVTLDKGGNTVSASKFYPDITTVNWPTTPTNPPEGNPPLDFYGTYTSAGYMAGITETVVFTETTFRISDNENTPEDYLAFTIQRWDSVDVPQEYYSGYMKGYKFTGIITNGKPVSTNPVCIYGSQTAPGFTQSDLNTTVCHMYVYTNGSGANFSFIRTTFSKETGTDSKAAVTTASGDNRVFRKPQ